MQIANKRLSPLRPLSIRRQFLRILPYATMAMALSTILRAQTPPSGQDLFGKPVTSGFGGRICLGVGDSGQFMAVRQVLDGEASAITFPDLA